MKELLSLYWSNTQCTVRRMNPRRFLIQGCHLAHNLREDRLANFD